jgi:hypothetical protein
VALFVSIVLMSTTKILFMASTAAIALSAFTFRPALAIPSITTTANTSFTTSTAEVDTIIDTPAMFHLTFPTTITRFSMVKEIGHAVPPFSRSFS